MQTIEWYRGDGSLHPTTKTRLKYYDAASSHKEAKRRRDNVRSHMMVGTLTLLLYSGQATDYDAALAMGLGFLAPLAEAVELYVETGAPALSDAIAADVTTTWLGTNVAPLIGVALDPNSLGVMPAQGQPWTIRDYLLDQLSTVGL